MASPQSYQARSMGDEGVPIFINSALSPITGDFYLIQFASQSTIGHLHSGNALNISGQQFAAGFVMGGSHAVVHLNSGSAMVYGHQS
jgi:hypothetical protein